MIDNAELGLMYRLCSKVERGLPELRQTMQTYVTQCGHDAIVNVADQAINDPKVYMTAILDVHNTYQRLVLTAFENDAGFVMALDKACTAFINKNAVTEKAQNVAKSAELIARYCDLTLKKSAKNPQESEMEDLIRQIVSCCISTVVKYCRSLCRSRCSSTWRTRTSSRNSTPSFTPSVSSTICRPVMRMSPP